MAGTGCVKNEVCAGSAFHYVDNALYCEKISVSELEQQVATSSGNQQRGVHQTTPLFVYSRQQLVNNIKSYKDACDGRIKIFYAVKANANLHLMKMFCNEKTGAVTVSGFELMAALRVGFEPSSILLNGNGKQKWEIELAVNNGCMLNVDSVFDAENIASVVASARKAARVLIRVNPELDHASTPVHQYLATALKDSKFGVSLNLLDKALDILQKEELIEVIGLHCHVGSTIRDASVYETVLKVLLDIREKMSLRGLNIQYLDIGGGLGIDYYRGTSNETTISTVTELMNTIKNVLPADVNLILEPGRSLIANTGMLLTRVLGTKGAEEPGRIVVVDAAMTDLIRPSFYKAYHHILPVSHDAKSDAAGGTFDVVGPVCESGDFIAMKRSLARAPVKEDLLAIMDVGAYGMAMASNYNMRGRAAEVLVDGDSWKLIRRREDFDSLVETMIDL